MEVPTGPSYGPGVSVGVGFNQPTYPNMVLVPGYPVYYYPYGSANYFFYSGAYWLYQGDRWYSSNWYNGPWAMCGSDYVPYYLLQVPVRYYRAPPPYFHGWRPDEPPHWGEHWGRDWEERHQGWSERARTMPPPAPLPRYQAAYSGNRYPLDRAQQDTIRNQNDDDESQEGMTQPAPQPYGRPPYSQQEHAQPHQAPTAPDWQARQQGQPPVQYQPPHEQGNWQQQASPSPASQSTKPQEPPRDDHSNQWQAHRPPTQDTAAPTHPHQEQHRESPQPAAGEPPHPSRKHPQTTPPSDQSSAPANEGQAKQSPPAKGQAKKSQSAPDASGDRDDDRR